ncbi:hypothetical protein BPAE_0294g00090 [Botrytis paeoniae]|uniref:FAD-binding PCMH-type domain-containing protein n=1 Tax=Botrytis paeoniae TaxID=278948 RepID=A0A4Z1FCD4_9HELO|nr:hypothetical protein BPAE_0294g00090 [Botrytis paeoniae]
MCGSKAILLGITCVIRNAVAMTALQVAEGLQASLSSGSSIFLSSNVQYSEQITPRWDVYEPPTYQVAVKPALIEDVKAIVSIHIQYASTNKLPFLATGGGHGYTTTLGSLQNGLVLDMGNFKTMELNSTTNMLTIGGSIKSSDVTPMIQAAGKEFPVGQCTCVGLTGFTLGGGIGPYSSLYGPASDSVYEIEMVSGAGEILTVSKDQNPDLFWGMRGAGFNYGVVTSITYNVYDATNGGNAINADMTFTGAQNGTIWKIMESFVGKQPDQLSISAEINFSATSGIIILVNLLYAGPQEELDPLMQPFLDLQPSNLNISSITWHDIPSSFLYGASVQGCSVTGIEYIPYSVNLYQIDIDNLINAVNFMNTSMTLAPELQTATIALDMYAQGGFQRNTYTSSAFPYRDVVIFAQIDCFALDASATPALAQWGKEMRDILHQGSGKANLEVYVHFAHGDEGNAAWYTEHKLKQLKELKNKYDPNSLFSFYNPVLNTSSSSSIVG